MAAVAFGSIVATGVGGWGVGAAIAATVGSIIDNYWISELFSDEASNPSMGSLEANLADEGSPAQYGVGANFRTAASYVFLGVPYATAQSGSSKRGGAANWTWYADAVISFNYGIPWTAGTGSTIQAVDKIAFDGEIVYLRDQAFEISGTYGTTDDWQNVYYDNQNSVQRWQRQNIVFNNVTGKPIRWDWELVAWHATFEALDPYVGVNFQQFQPGSEITIRRDVGGPNYAEQIDIPIVAAYTGLNGKDQYLVVDLMPHVTTGQREVLNSTNPAPPVNTYPIGYWGAPPYSTGEVWEFEQQGLSPTGWKPDSINDADFEFKYGHADGATNRSTNWGTYMGATQSVPGLPGIAYAWLPGIDLSSYGQRPPHIAVWQNDYTVALPTTHRPVEQIVSHICEKYSGIPATRLDTTAVAGPGMRGMSWVGAVPGGQLIGNLVQAFNWTIKESSGKLYFIYRNRGDEVSFNPDSADARPFGTPASAQITEMEDGERGLLPRQVHLRYIDSERDLEWGGRYSSRDGLGLFQTEAGGPGVAGDVESRQVEIPITLTGTEAGRVVQRLERQSWEERRRAKVKLPAYFLTLSETDILKTTASYQGRTWRLVIDRMQVTNDMLVECDCIVLDEDVSAQEPTGGTGSGFGEPIAKLFQRGGSSNRVGMKPPPYIATEVIDVASLSQGTAFNPGVYVATSNTSPQTSFPGASIYMLENDATNWTYMGQGAPCTMGYVVGTPTIATDQPHTSVEYVSQITVRLYGDSTLSSVSEDQAIEGANRCVIGDEVMHFVNATLQADGTYLLNGFVRGALGTEDEIGAHQVNNERFVLLDSNVVHVPVDLTEFGIEKVFVAIGRGSVLGATELEGRRSLVRYQAMSARSPKVTSVQGSRLSPGGDVKLQWSRRSRILVKDFGPLDVPVPEGAELYHIKAFDAGAFVREWYTTVRKLTYTLAEQTADGVNGNDLEFSIAQVDPITGDGPLKFITVTA